MRFPFRYVPAGDGSSKSWRASSATWTRWSAIWWFVRRYAAPWCMLEKGPTATSSEGKISWIRWSRGWLEFNALLDVPGSCRRMSGMGLGFGRRETSKATKNGVCKREQIPQKRGAVPKTEAVADFSWGFFAAICSQILRHFDHRCLEVKLKIDYQMARWHFPWWS